MDVVIPAFNPTAHELQRAIASARKIKSVDRVILADDGSAAPINDTLAHVNTRPDVIIKLAENKGPSAARNAGAAKATADFILFLDADDELLGPGVETLLHLATQLDAFAAVAPRQFDAHDHRSTKPLPKGWANNVLRSPAEIFRPIELFGASSMLVRKQVFAQGTRFDTQLLIGEDRDFLRKVAMLGPIAISQAPALLTHRSGSSLTSTIHLERRVKDHLVLIERWCDDESNANFQSATNWLINACSKSPPSEAAWEALLDAATNRRWPISIKARLRHRLNTMKRDR